MKFGQIEFGDDEVVGDPGVDVGAEGRGRGGHLEVDLGRVGAGVHLGLRHLEYSGGLPAEVAGGKGERRGEFVAQMCWRAGGFVADPGPWAQMAAGAGVGDALGAQ